MSTEGIKVYVDDLRACPVGWTLARTITEAIRLLAQFNVAEISIDHDIMHAVKPLKMIPLPASVKIVDEEKFLRYCDQGIEVPIACAETYEPVVWFIAAMPERLRPIVRFHTANPAGREKMEAVLRNFRWPENDLRERLASLCHEQWSGWMIYLFSECDIDWDTLIPSIPDSSRQRWARQMTTPYEKLSQEEQDSDRAEADKFIALLRGEVPV